MTDHVAPAAPDPDPGRLPEHTTPTWEVELLISGVAVFAMLQLPGWLDSQLFALTPRLDVHLASITLPLYLYLKSTALVLAVTFALHLTLRANWIALVGLHSVHPDGVLWARLRMGPVQRELEQQRFGSAADSIERADNRATVVFAIGVMLAMRLLLLSALFCVLFGVLLAITTLAGIQIDLFQLFCLCMGAAVLAMVLAQRIDRTRGERLRQGGLPRRVLAGTFRWLARCGIGRRSEGMALLSSHGNERIINLLITAAFLILFMAVLLGLDAAKSPLRTGSYAAFPSNPDSTRRIHSAYYDDQRDPRHDAATPYLQSAVIEGPYLKLTVPYQPQHDAPAVRRTCATALALPATPARDDTLLDCLGRLHTVSLDGVPLDTLRYDAGSDPRTSRPALQAMIDVHALAPGRHVLRVSRAPNAGASDVIVFWR